MAVERSGVEGEQRGPQDPKMAAYYRLAAAAALPARPLSSDCPICQTATRRARRRALQRAGRGVGCWSGWSGLRYCAWRRRRRQLPVLAHARLRLGQYNRRGGDHRSLLPPAGRRVRPGAQRGGQHPRGVVLLCRVPAQPQARRGSQCTIGRWLTRSSV